MRRRPKPGTRRLLWLGLALFCGAACERQTPGRQPPGGAAAKVGGGAAEPAAGAAPQPAPAPPPAPTGPIEDIDLGPLKVESWPQVVAKLERAHYDAEVLGLREVRFTLSYRSKRQAAVEALAKGRWKPGGPPELELTQVKRDGKVLAAPEGEEQIGQKVAWERLHYKLLKLIEGLGNGFLSRRIFDWRSARGAVKQEGDHLLLTYTQEKLGQTTIEVGPGYAVQRVSIVAPEGYTRSMTYKTRSEGGRNLVVDGLFSTRMDKPLHDKARITLEAMDGNRFQISYDKVGRYWLPVKLVKTIPKLAEQLDVELKYEAALP